MPGIPILGIFVRPLIHNATESVRLFSVAPVPFLPGRMLNARTRIIAGIEIVSALIFDFDGVITDSEAIANTVLAESVTRLGHSTTLDEALTR